MRGWEAPSAPARLDLRPPPARRLRLRASVSLLAVCACACAPRAPPPPAPTRAPLPSPRRMGPGLRPSGQARGPASQVRLLDTLAVTGT